MDNLRHTRHTARIKFVVLSPLAALAACSFTASSVPFDATNDAGGDGAIVDGNTDASFDATDDAASDARRDAASDAAGNLLTWVQDTEADFATGTTNSAMVTPWNTVEPQAFAPGWILRGKAGSAFNDENALDFASLDNARDRKSVV